MQGLLTSYLSTSAPFGQGGHDVRIDTSRQEAVTESVLAIAQGHTARRRIEALDTALLRKLVALGDDFRHVYTLADGLYGFRQSAVNRALLWVS